MKKHVWRPLYVVIGIVVLILLARQFIVPEDFGVEEDQGYMYGFHRQGNVQEWKDFPNKYQSSAYCNDCHDDKVSAVENSQHAMIPCENCHGAAFDHPEDPEKLVIDRSRDLCLRCHARLYTPTSGRSSIPGIEPDEHNPGMECSDCHNPHDPNLEEM